MIYMAAYTVKLALNKKNETYVQVWKTTPDATFELNFYFVSDWYDGIGVLTQFCKSKPLHLLAAHYIKIRWPLKLRDRENHCNGLNHLFGTNSWTRGDTLQSSTCLESVLQRKFFDIFVTHVWRRCDVLQGKRGFIPAITMATFQRAVHWSVNLVKNIVSFREMSIMMSSLKKNVGYFLEFARANI